MKLDGGSVIHNSIIWDNHIIYIELLILMEMLMLVIP